MSGIPGWAIQLFVFIVVVLVMVWAALTLGLHF